MAQFNDSLDFRKRQEVMRRSLKGRVIPPKSTEPVPPVTRTFGGPEGDTVLSTEPTPPPATAPVLPEDVSPTFNQGAGQTGYGNFETPEQKALRLAAQRRTPAGYGI